MGITELSNALGINKSVVSRLVSKGMPTSSTQAAQAWREIYAKPRAKRGMAGIAPPAPKIEKPRKSAQFPEDPATPWLSELRQMQSSGKLPTAEDVDRARWLAAEDGSEVAQNYLQSIIRRNSILNPQGSTTHADDNEPEPPQPARSEGSHDEPADSDNTPRQSLRRARLAEKVGYNELVMTKRNGGSIEDIRKANQVYISSRNNRHKAERDFKEWQRDEGILLFFDEAKDIASRPHIAAKQMLEVMAKTLAPRLYGQSQKAIEKTLGDWVDTLTEVIRKGI